MSYREGHHFSFNYKEGQEDTGVDYSGYSLDELKNFGEKPLIKVCMVFVLVCMKMVKNLEIQLLRSK